MPEAESTPEDVSPSGASTDGKAKRIDIKLPPSMRSVLDTLRQDEESDAAVVKRILDDQQQCHDEVNEAVNEVGYLQELRDHELREKNMEIQRLEKRLNQKSKLFEDVLYRLTEIMFKLQEDKHAEVTEVE